MWIVLLFSIGSYAVCEELAVYRSSPGTNITLNCTAKSKPGVEYYAVRWYKESVDPRLTGLASLSLPDGEMRWYIGADTRISVDKSLKLHLPTVNCSDQGVYQCYLAAPVGQQNREGRIQLRVEGCPTDAPSEVKSVDEPEETDVHVQVTPLPCQYNVKTFICGAVIVVLLISILMFLGHKCLKKNLWTQSKTTAMENFHKANFHPEKQNLIWIFPTILPPQKTVIAAA